MAATVSQRRAMIAFSLGCLYFFYAFVQRVSPSVVTGELMRDFSVGGAALGVLSAMYFYPYALVQLPVGMLVDRFGPRRLLAVTATICAMSSWWFSAADSLAGASLARALIGVTVGFSFVGTLSIAATFFTPARFAMLSGMLLAVGMCGAIAGQVPLRLMVEYGGWRYTFVILALLALVLAFLMYLLVPRRPVQQSDATAPSRSVLAGLGAVSANPQSWLCAGAGFGLSAAMLSFAGLWAVPWMTMTIGIDDKVAAGISSLMFVGWAVGSPLAGWLSDRLGRRKPILISGAVVALLSIGLIVYGNVTDPSGLGALFFINGLGSCCMVVCFGLSRELNAREYNGTAISLVNMCVVGSGALLQPLIGWLLDLNWDGALQAGARQYSAAAFEQALFALVMAGLLALLCALRVRESWCRPLEDAG